MQNSSGNGTVLWELDARGVASVILNRPEVNNAYNGDLISGVHAAMDALFADLVREHAAVRQLAEAAEGLASFREKRKPSWYPAAA